MPSILLLHFAVHLPVSHGIDQDIAPLEQGLPGPGAAGYLFGRYAV
jgi:hypothetical protein